MLKRFLLAALAGCLMASVAAADPAAPAKPKRTVVSTKVFKKKPGKAQPAVKAFVDPDTKKLRAPTPEEAAAAAASYREPTPIREIHYSDGMVAVELGDDYLVDAVAVKNPDGTVTTTCTPRNERGMKKSAPAAEDR